MITLQGHIIVPDADLEQVEAELPRHIELTRAEPGCQVFEGTRSANQPNRYDVFEQFDSADAYHQHQQRVESSHWGRVTRHVERHYTVSGLE